MNVSDIKTRVKREFGDESAVQIQDADIYRWITDAQVAIVVQNEAILQTSSTTPSVINQADYTLPTDIVHLNSILYKNFKLKKYTLQEMEEYIDGWQDNTLYGSGVPVIYTVYASSFSLFPAPSSAGDTIKIYYSKRPTDVTSDSDPLSVPVLYHEAIVNYCEQRAHELDEDWAAAQQKDKQFNDRVNLLRDRETYSEDKFYPSITFLAEDF